MPKKFLNCLNGIIWLCWLFPIHLLRVVFPVNKFHGCLNDLETASLFKLPEDAGWLASEVL